VIGGLAQTMFLLALPSAAAVALFVLRKGERQGFPVLLGAAIVSTVVGVAVESRPGFDYPVALLLLFPTYLGAKILRATENQGLAILAITACAMLFALAVQLLSGDAEQWWNNWLKSAVQGVPGASYETLPDDMPALNGLIALFLAMMSAASLFSARWVQAVLFNPGGFGREFRTLATPKRIFTALLALLPVAAFIQATLLYDIAFIAALPLFFQGLAVLQHTAVTKRLSIFFMSIPYVLLLIMPQIVVIGYACLGGIDMFFNFRKLPRTKL
jgi:uncharacterized protein YybS (DUF2232 family)